MMVIVFSRFTHAGRAWYVWASASAQLLAFTSVEEAQAYADGLTEACHGLKCPYIDRSIEQGATLI